MSAGPVGVARSTDTGHRLVLSLLGAAAVLYALGQVPAALAGRDISALSPFDGVFGSGNLALAVVLGCWGFLLTRTLLSARDRSPRHALEAGAWVLVPLVASTVLVCLGAVVVSAVDDTQTATRASTTSAVQRSLTFTFNWWQRANLSAPDVRRDLATQWVGSIAVQLTVLAILAVLLLGGRPVLLAGVATAAAVGAAGQRVAELHESGWVVVALGTVERADAFLLGVAVAAVATRIRIDAGRAGAVLGGAVLVLAGATLAPDFVEVDRIFEVLLPFAAIVTAVAVAVAGRATDGRMLAVQLLERPGPALVGSLWFPVVVWAPFVGVTVGRHAGLQPTLVLVVGVLVGTAVLTAATHWLLAATERAVAAWTEHRRRRPASAQVGGDDRGAGGQPPADG